MASFAVSANAFLASPNKVKSLGPNPSTSRGAGIHIGAHPREPRIIYASGKYVVVRSLVDPSDCFIYRAHAFPVTVAKFSPNGYWVASGDTSGKVRVWSWDNPEHITKLETPVFAGEIKDLDWDSESKKIVAVGDGSPMTCKVFTWDTGNSVGEMVGHNKRVLSTSFKPTRPFRIFTGGEDMKTIIFAGPPFKLQKSFTEVHSNFVNCVRYSPNGNRVVSVGSDKKMQFYEGATGDLLGEVSNAHAGSIYSASFSADSTKLLTSSADKTVKLWDVETRTCEKTFTFGTELGDMQVSVLWAGSYMVSVSLSGNINILNPADPTKPSTVFNAHQVAITSMAYDAVTRTLYSGSFDGVLCATPVDTGISTRIVGADKKLISAGVHTNKISGVVVTNGQVLSVAWDDTVRTTDIATKSAVASQSLNGQPCGIAAAKDSDLVVVATTAEIAVFRGTNKINAFSDVSFGATCIAITANGDEVAVGGNDNKTRIYSVAADGSMTAVTTIATRSPVSALAYSPVSDVLAIGDNGRQVEVYERGTWTPRVQGRWVNHTSRITALAWSPNGQFLASGSTDESIFIWNSAKNISFHQLNFTHHSGVSGVAWIDDTHLVSTGNDHCIVTWDLTAAIAAI